MLQWFIRFLEFAEFTEFPFYLGMVITDTGEKKKRYV